MIEPNNIFIRNLDYTIAGDVEGFESLEGYSIKLTAKKRKEDADIAFECNGSISGLTVTFNLTSSMLDKEPGVYYIDIIASKDTKRYPLIGEDTIEIVQGVS